MGGVVFVVAGVVALVFGLVKWRGERRPVSRPRISCAHCGGRVRMHFLTGVWVHVWSGGVECDPQGLR